MARRASRAAIPVAGAAAAGLAWYHGQTPTSQAYGATICRLPAARGLYALTYDDGPNPAHTPALLDLLERHGARATFFTVGKWALREPALLREVRDAGHAIGNHTWSHPTMPLLSAEQVCDEMRRTRDAAEGAGVQFSEVAGEMLMRPPYGRRRPGTLRTVRAEGYVPILWSITCWDWRERESAAKFAARGAKAGDGDLILLHDGGHREPAADRSRSVAATEEILRRLAAQGLRSVTVPELAAAAGGQAPAPAG